MIDKHIKNVQQNQINFFPLKSNNVFIAMQASILWSICERNKSSDSVSSNFHLLFT